MRQRKRRIERERRKKLQKLWLILFGILVILIIILCITKCGRSKVDTVAPAQATEEVASETTPAPAEPTPALTSIPAPSAGNNGLLDLIKASGQTHHVYLTFDEGPDPDVTPKILDALRRYDVKATFFVIGREIEKYPYLITRIMDEGHLVLRIRGGVIPIEGNDGSTATGFVEMINNTSDTSYDTVTWSVTSNGVTKQFETAVPTISGNGTAKLGLIVNGLYDENAECSVRLGGTEE
ncbi:MAG: polysaccharide deacetylase family protein [Clostridia bacterium]|nr:polysaccharide deacetylase family protein [Clostridia bacterium]